jgi:hypothetical protein
MWEGKALTPKPKPSQYSAAMSKFLSTPPSYLNKIDDEEVFFAALKEIGMDLEVREAFESVRSWLKRDGWKEIGGGEANDADWYFLIFARSFSNDVAEATNQAMLAEFNRMYDAFYAKKPRWRR